MQNIYTKDFRQTGVYEIKNIINSKKYIGSTTMSFSKRLEHHRCLLRNGTHKNKHLQRAWDKYGEDNFEFNILEVVDKCCTLTVEQTYLDDCKDCYNINPLATGTPDMSKETIEKRTATFTITNRKGIEYYFKVKNGEISIENVPEKYIKIVEYRLNTIPWNKGKDYTEINYSYLKGVPKTVTEKTLLKNKKDSEKSREKSPNVFVYDLNMNFIGEWRSSKDIEEFSLTEESNLPIVLSRVDNRRPPKYLCSGNIMKVFDTDKTYKGLYFKSYLI